MSTTHFQRRTLRGMIAATQVLSLVAGTGLMHAQIARANGDGAATGNISGKVFQDYNANGQLDTASGAAIDRGIGGIVVTAYAPTGAAAGSAITDGNGDYSIATAGTGPYRVEFTSLPVGFHPSARSAASFGANTAGMAGSSVQFVNEGGAGNVNLAINNPSDYCQNNPGLATCIMWQGNPVTGPNNAEPVLRVFPNSAGASASSTTVAAFDAPASSPNTPANQLGTVQGLGYDRANRRIYAAAYYKRHAGFGSGGPGRIYRVNAATGAVVGGFTVPNVLPGGVTELHDTAAYLAYTSTASFDRPGKVSLGGLALNDAGTELFVMNLTDRTLYKFNPASGALSGSVAVPTSGLATSGSRICAASDVRPFAVDFYRGSVYVGAVCSAQSTSNTADLYAYVWRVDPATLSFSGLPVFAAPLSYNRGYVDDPSTKPAEWNPWATTYPNAYPAGSLAPGYPQPMLAGIQFDRDGDMILGLRDRFGDQMGNQIPSAAPTLNADLIGISGGDMLRACASTVDAVGNASTWTLENNGACEAGTGSGPTPATSPNGSPLTAQGPGNGEYYGGDGWYPGGDEHDEVMVGGVLQIPGYTDVAATAFNPIPGALGPLSFDNGVRWLSNASGQHTRAYRLIDGDYADGRIYAKANGIGELIALCDAAPIEIGNRVWNDGNGNGIQDADERGISGVRVELFVPDQSGAYTTRVGSALTGTDGEYYFVGSATADADVSNNIGEVLNGIQPGMPYRIVITPPAGLNLTVRDAAIGANADAIDSDAVINAGNAVIDLTTGVAGHNDHTFDAGFSSPSSGTRYALGNRTWIDANDNGVQDAGEAGVQTTLRLFQAGTLTQVGPDISSSADGYYCFDGLAAGDYVVEAVTPSGYRSSTVDAGDPDIDVDDQDDNGVSVVISTAVRSAAVTLGPGASEPVNEADASPAGLGCAVSQLADGHKNETVDFGFYQALSLGNLVFIDTNNSGARDGEEAGLDGVTVSLYRDANNDGTPDGVAITTTQTANGGQYLFTGLISGTYLVEILPPPGYTSSTGNNTEPAQDPDVVQADNDDNGTTVGGVIRSAPVTLTPGDEPQGETPADPSNTPDPNGNMTVDFGLQQPAELYAVGNRVWLDADNNGAINAVDGVQPGLPNIAVRLYAANASGQPQGLPLQSTLTNATGYYCFGNLGAGAYVIEVTQPADHASSTTESATPDNNIDSDDNGVTLLTGAVRSGVVTLGPGSVEPANEEGAAQCTTASQLPDGRTNYSVDFGFYRVRATAITLADFSISASASGATVNWRTSLESNTFGFHVLRGASPDRAQAVRINSALIAARGGSEGAAYRIDDAQSAAGMYYWLEEVELSGKTQFYGPVQLAGASPVADTATQPQTIVIAQGSVPLPAVVESRSLEVVAVGVGSQSVVVGGASPVVIAGEVSVPQGVQQAQPAEVAVPDTNPVQGSEQEVVNGAGASGAPVAQSPVAMQPAPQREVVESQQVVVGARSAVQVARGAQDALPVARQRAVERAGSVAEAPASNSDLSMRLMQAGVSALVLILVGVVAMTRRKRRK
jgi:hypothetical protein